LAGSEKPQAFGARLESLEAGVPLRIWVAMLGVYQVVRDGDCPQLGGGKPVAV